MATALATTNLPMLREQPKRTHLDEGVAVICLAGRAVLLDTTDYHPDGRTHYVVINPDGGAQIEVPDSYDGHKFFGDRSGIGGRRRVGKTYERSGVIILGRVLREL